MIQTVFKVFYILLMLLFYSS